MNVIIFNSNNYNQLPKDMKRLYEHIGGYVHALKPKYLKIDLYKLPKHLSKAQYVANRAKIGSYYTLTTVGFHKEAVPLMKLDERIATGTRLSYINSSIPKSARITRLEYLKLKPTEQIKYREITIGNNIYYIKTDITLAKTKVLPDMPVRPPLTGVVKIPIGRWVEVH